MLCGQPGGHGHVLVLEDITNIAKVLRKGNQNLTETGARERELVRFDESSPGHPGWEVKVCAKA